VIGLVEAEVYKTRYGRNVGPSSRFSQFQSTMAAILSSLLAGSALLNVVNAQDFGGGARDEDAFSYVQPLDTVILGEYGHSPAVYPARKFTLCTVLQA
jgi:hypothetical protein